MTTDIYRNGERRNSTSSTTSNPYKNQLTASHRKSQYNKTSSELRHTITGDSFKSKYDNSKITKPQMHFSPKVSLFQGREALLNGRHNQSNMSSSNEVMTDRGTVKPFSGVNPATTRESGSNRDQQKFYRRVKDIMQK